MIKDYSLIKLYYFSTKKNHKRRSIECHGMQECRYMFNITTVYYYNVIQ